MQVLRMEYPASPGVFLEAYVLDCELALGQDTERPAVVVCPGGGYLYLSPREAEPVALAYAARGLHAFVLHYSVGRQAAGFKPLEELSWAIGTIRRHAGEWHVAPDKIAACGFSAGGHLALAAGLLAENKPNALILGYPAVAFARGPQMDFLFKLLLGKQAVTDEEAARFDLPAQVGAGAPPLFLFGTAEDKAVGDGLLRLAGAYAGRGLPFEMHLFQFGPHGLSLATAETADGSAGVLDERAAAWQPLSVSWLRKIFGEPVFTDKSTSRIGQYLAQFLDGGAPEGTEFA